MRVDKIRRWPLPFWSELLEISEASCQLILNLWVQNNDVGDASNEKLQICNVLKCVLVEEIVKI